MLANVVGSKTASKINLIVLIKKANLKKDFTVCVLKKDLKTQKVKRNLVLRVSLVLPSFRKNPTGKR